MLKCLYNQLKTSRNEYIKVVKNEKSMINKFKKMLPNILTCSRFIAPFIIVPIALSNLTLALIPTTLFALTDAFDGYFARKYDAHSEYGRILDTICDKVFAIGLTIPILVINPLLMISTIVLEIAIAMINLNSAYKLNNPKSTYLGKFKTCLLSLNLVLNYFNIINIPFILGTNLVQLITAIDYYNIDKKKDIETSNNNSVFLHDEIEYSNDLEREKNELLELRKSLISNEDNIEKRLTKHI